MPPLPRLLIAGICLILCLAAPAEAESPPRGRLIWTQVRGTTFSIHTTVYGPDGEPLNPNTLPVPPAGTVINVDNRTLMFSPTGAQLLADGQLDKAKPSSVVHFLHPAFDFTGRRVIWAGGPTWGPKDLPPATRATGTPATLSTVEGGTTLFYGEPTKQATELSSQDGEAMDAFPTSDPQAQWVYFARMFYGPGKVPFPGWYLMRKARSQFLAGTDKSAELVEDSQGNPIYGSQPFISETGEHLLFVKPDPDNPGTDLYYIKMPPEENEQVKLWEGEGEADFTPPEVGSTPDPNLDPWLRYMERLGKARISNPVMTSDSKLIVYSSDRSAEGWSPSTKTETSWDLYALEIERESDGTLRGVREEQIGQASEPDLDEMWPTVSGDGFWIGYMVKPRTGGETKLQLLQIRSERDTSGRLSVQGSPRDVRGSDEGAMWPRWDQDEDPPTVLVRISVKDGSPPVTLLLQDQDPDSSSQTDTVTMGLQIRNYNEAIPEAPKPSPANLPSLDFWGPEKSLHMPYQTQGVTENSLFMLLAGERDIGNWKGFKARSPVPVRASRVDQSHLKVLGEKDFKGLFVGENIRLEITVQARDNRWKRVPPDDDTRGLYSTDPLVEVSQIREDDLRSRTEADGKRKEPYLDLIPMDKNMNDKLPGITWWLEEGPHGTDNPDDIKPSQPSQENAPYLLFRFGNFPKKDGKPDDDPRNQDRFLRIVCRDLLSNVTDIRIPIYIKTRDFSVDTIQSGSQRATGGP